jgi:hypothetical protein
MELVIKVVNSFDINNLDIIEYLEQPNLVKIKVNEKYFNSLGIKEYYPFVLKKTLIDENYNNNMKELDCIILSKIINYTEINVNIHNTNKNEYSLEFLTKDYNQIYIQNSIIDYFILPKDIIFISDNMCMYLINDNSIIKHTILDIWYCSIDNINIINNIKIKLNEFDKNNIKCVPKTKRSNELIKAFKFEIIQSLLNYHFIKFQEPFTHSWFMESLETIEKGEIPIIKYEVKNDYFYLKNIYCFMKIYIKTLDINILNVRFIFNDLEKLIIFQIENIHKYNYIINNFENIEDISINYKTFDSLEERNNIRYSLSKNNIKSMIYEKFIIWEKNNKIYFVENELDIYDDINIKNIYINDGIITKINGGFKISTFFEETEIISNESLEIFKKEWTSGKFFTHWEKSF